MSRGGAPRRVGLFGILGAGNLGNDGSLEAVVRWLRRDHPDAAVGFMCMGTETIAARYGGEVTGLQWFEESAPVSTGPLGQGFKVLGRLLLDPIRTLRWVAGQDVVVVPGMGVMETTTPVRPWAFPWSLFCLAVAGRLTRTPVALVSVGANEVRQRSTRRLVTTAARLAAYRSYRDELSRTSMRRMGVDVSRDGIYPDLAFALPGGVPNPVQRPGTVAVGLMLYVGGNDDKERADALYAGYLACMQEFTSSLLDEGHDVLLFSGDDEDAPVVEAVHAHAVGRHPGLAPGRLGVLAAETLPGLLSELAGVDAVVASRYHNVLGALSVSRPTLSVGYAAKHLALMTTMCVPEYEVAAATVDATRLREVFTELQANRDAVVARLTARNAEFRAELEQQFRLLSTLLLGSADNTQVPA